MSFSLFTRRVRIDDVGCRPVIIEIPHFASLRGIEREIMILRSEDGLSWSEHKLKASDDVVFKAVNNSFDGKQQILTCENRAMNL